MKPLSQKQKALLGKMATQAYRRLVGAGAEYEDKDTWRHEVQLAITGHTSLGTCDQRHFVPLYNYYAAILGQSPMEDNTRSPKDIALWQLQREMERQELTLEYATAIGRDKFPHLRGYAASEFWEAVSVKLSAEQIKQLMFTIKSRGSAKTRRIDREVGL